ncbi:hydrolase [Synergistales bacterium]|nr:hydrolase [Synergistales bacterium]
MTNFKYPKMAAAHDFCMVGAMIGDISGSRYEFLERKIRRKPESLIGAPDFFTDDTVLTYAVAMGIWKGMQKIDRASLLTDTDAQSAVENEIARSLKNYARRYPKAGYGGRFREWVNGDSMEPYNSFGNGSAMRVSFAGWYARSLEEALTLAKLSARVTHSHEFGIKGAEAVAGCIYLLRTAHGKEEVRAYASKYYDLDFTLEEIRPTYAFDETCEGSVPQAIAAFLENDSFEDVIRSAIYVGGDSDTIAAIAGSIAEACYDIPNDLIERATSKLDLALKSDVRTISEILREKISQ